MKRYLLSLACMSMACTAVLASSAGPVVAPGDFACFPGMSAADINYLPASENKSGIHKVARVDKLGNSKWDNADGHDLREVPTEGDYKVLVVLVDFANKPFTVNNGEPFELVNDMLNGENFTDNKATGSANRFFNKISGGQFNPIFNLYGPVHLSQNESYYVSRRDGLRPEYDRQYYTTADGKQQEVYYPGLMLKEVIEQLDGEIDFSDYDSNNDGKVDFVYLFFAGKGATTGGDERTTVWPHAFTLNSALGSPIMADGVSIDRYATSSELGTQGKLSGIGTFCHEFSHVLGLPDLYDTSSNGQQSKCFTPGTFSCMDSGNYNNSEHTPPLFSTYEQYSLEWIKPVVLDGTASVSLLPLTARKFGYKVETSRPQEYFLLETRAPYDNDYYLEGHGLLVWHIDFNESRWSANTPNNQSARQLIDIVEADNDKTAATRNGDTFPGVEGVCEFASNTTPNFTDWNGRATAVELENIMQHPDGVVTFNAMGDYKMPGFSLEAPKAHIMATSSSEISVAWDNVSGAKGYMVTVYPLEKYDGGLIKDFVEGYYFKDLGETTGVDIEGLEEGKSYGIYVYAYNDLNASRTPVPMQVATIAGSFDEARTNVYAYVIDDYTTIEWDEVKDATDYEVFVGTRTIGGDVEKHLTGFDGSVMPDGWTTEGRFETRDRYCGNAAPALHMEINGVIFKTAKFANPISNLSFKGRMLYDDPYTLDIYGEDGNGNTRFITSYAGMTRSIIDHSIDIPLNGDSSIRSIIMKYTSLATGQALYIDDVEITTVATYTDTPVASENIEITGKNSAKVTGLDPNAEYVTYVIPVNADGKGVASNELYFRQSGLESSVDGILDDILTPQVSVIDGVVSPLNQDMIYDIYSIDGTVLATGRKGEFILPAHGIFLLRSDGKTLKLAY